MKRIPLKLFLLTAFFQILMIRTGFSTAYNASSLYNSVTRAETVEQMFLDRWDLNKERNFYFDWYGKINEMSNLTIYTYDETSDTYNKTDMNLRRTYGSLTIAVPVNGFRKTPDEKDLIIALNTAGFHYGLTRDETLGGNGGAHGVSRTTEYRFTQFFDDIYALSLLWRPALIIHTGLIVNNEYTPNDSGKIKISDPDESYKRFFYSIELFNFLTFRTNIRGTDFESLKTSVNINNLLKSYIDISNTYFPSFIFGLEIRKAYKDEPYDAVWVDSPEGKDDNSSFNKDSALLSVASLLVTQKVFDNFHLDGYYAAQYINKDLYSKTDNKKISPPITKEWYVRFNYDPFKVASDFKSDLYLGISWYWEPGISIQRNSHGKGDGIYGWETGYSCDFKYIGAEFKIVHSFSSELRKLLEAADKYAWELSLFIRI